MPVKRFWLDLSLRGKFRMLTFIGILIWLSNFSIIYFEIHDINRTTLDLEKCEDLYNTVLEIRRYEKNYLLYHERQDLTETLNKFHSAPADARRTARRSGNQSASQGKEKPRGRHAALRRFAFGPGKGLSVQSPGRRGSGKNQVRRKMDGRPCQSLAGGGETAGDPGRPPGASLAADLNGPDPGPVCPGRGFDQPKDRPAAHASRTGDDQDRPWRFRPH